MASERGSPGIGNFSGLYVNKYLILDMTLIYMFIRNIRLSDTTVGFAQRPTSIMPVNISMKIAMDQSNTNVKCAERNFNLKKI